MADTKISALALAAALTGAELFLGSQGAADVQATLTRLKDELTWVRPADWTAMPAPAANTIRLRALVRDVASQAHAVRATTSSGTYSVDWGDGSSPTTGVASGATATKSYVYADAGLGAASTRGYKTAIITITPDSGNLTVLNLSISPSGFSTNGNFLELQIHASSMTTISNLGTQYNIEYVNIAAIGTVTACTFDGWVSLRKIDEPGTLLTNLTSTAALFRDCYNLRRVNLAGLGTGITAANAMFSNCFSLRDLTFPSGTLNATLTNVSQMFNGCYNLQTVSFPSGAFSGSISNASQMFLNCRNLRRVVFPSGALALVANLSGIFDSCYSLNYVEFAGALTAVTNISTMFNACITLEHVKFTTGSFGSLATASTPFNNSGKVSRIENWSVPITHSLANCRLGAAALDEVYNALPSVTATITVTGNPGTSGDDPSIATAKGWTVTGS